MATIAGSQFVVSTPLGYAGVNIVETPTGVGIGGDTLPGDFNLEVYTGAGPIPMVAAPGYEGLAVLTNGGAELILQAGAYAVTDNGTGNDQIVVSASLDTVSAGSGTDTMSVYGNFDTVGTGAGADTVNVFGSFDTVGSGDHGAGSTALIGLNGNFETLADGPNTYADTVVGFSQSNGDTIHLTGADTAAYAVAHASSSGGNTLITLNDGSTILLKGVTHIDTSFFS